VTGQSRPDLARLARERRELREARKRLHPPAAVPPTARWKFGPIDISFAETQKRNAASGTQLSGFAVSPGRVTAPASVILSPTDFDTMIPDTILVCPTTNPAWTPLFAQARGLVTDIGGIAAHGSIVAREYGIPAVMGTGNATQRIVSGQMVTVDGDAGVVTLAMPIER
jgi:pyruvate,water dikinase